MKHYTYYGRTPQGGIVAVLQITGAEEPTWAQLDEFRRQFMASGQQPMNTPRPEWVSVVDLQELPPPPEGVEKKGVTLLVPSRQNGHDASGRP